MEQGSQGIGRQSRLNVKAVVETAPAAELCSRLEASLYQALLSAVPIPDPRPAPTASSCRGEVADPANTPPGCHFHPRCKYAQQVCRGEVSGTGRDCVESLCRAIGLRELPLRGVARSTA